MLTPRGLDLIPVGGMVAPNPSVVTALAWEIATRAEKIAQEYEWAHGMAYSGRVYESVKVRLQAISPTEAIASSNPSYHLQACYESLLSLDADMKSVEAALLRMQDAFDPPTREHVDILGRTTRVNVALAKQAQARRQARGEAIP